LRHGIRIVNSSGARLAGMAAIKLLRLIMMTQEFKPPHAKHKT
jgi:hypothetical protein